MLSNSLPGPRESAKRLTESGLPVSRAARMPVSMRLLNEPRTAPWTYGDCPEATARSSPQMLAGGSRIALAEVPPWWVWGSGRVGRGGPRAPRRPNPARCAGTFPTGIEPARCGEGSGFEKTRRSRRSRGHGVDEGRRSDGGGHELGADQPGAQFRRFDSVSVALSGLSG